MASRNSGAMLRRAAAGAARHGWGWVGTAPALPPRISEGVFGSAGWDATHASSLSARGMKIYTRTGDKGRSSLFNGARRRKDDAIFDCLGAIDELNSQIGLAKEHILEAAIDDGLVAGRLDQIQRRLLDIASHVDVFVGVRVQG
ncbi:cobalamin adenosyltransferase-domain-containing protein [Baffinella frigidus]|nr:cobalamin adenosyltransferase-domain-containing protein [Cryptophyta sp. CCMP2293]